MLIDQTGMVALVTGGSSGIGLETARMLLETGADVAICGRDPDRLAAAVESLSDVNGGDLLAKTCDVLDPEQVTELAQAVRARFGRLDMLICAMPARAVPRPSPTPRTRTGATSWSSSSSP